MSQQIEKQATSYVNIREIYQSVFMIHKILVVNQETSLPVFEKDVEYTVPFESAMISGILQAISSIGQEMIGRPTDFKKLEFNGFVVTGSYFNGYTIYVFSETKLDKKMEEGMKNFIKWFSITFKSKRENWDGNLDLFKINNEIINSKLTESMFLWLLFPLVLIDSNYLETKNLSGLALEILRCINQNLRCTPAKLLDRFKPFGEEEVLNAIFQLVNNEIISTSSKD